MEALRALRTRSATSTPATTTSPPRATTPSGASTSVRSARRRCSASCARCSARARSRLRALAGDRRRHRLLQPQPAAGRRRRRGHLHRHLARDGRHPERQRAAAGSPGPHRARRRRVPPLPRRELRPRPRPRRAPPPARPSSGRSASFTASCVPAARMVFAGEPSRVGDRLARSQARPAHCSRRCGGGLICARPAPPAEAGPKRRTRTTSSSGASTSTPSSRWTSMVPRQAGRFHRRQGPRRGAGRQLVRVVQPHARGKRRPRGRADAVAPVRVPRLPRAAAARRACSSHCSHRPSSTTCCSAP